MIETSEKKQVLNKASGLKKFSLPTTAALASTFAFVPVFFLFLLPMLSRNHFANEVSVPPEVFLSAPSRLILSDIELLQDTFRVIFNDTSFAIPNDFTPVYISKEKIKFRNHHNRLGRTISIRFFEQTDQINFNGSDFVSFFIPPEPFEALNTIFSSTWHPVRLMIKAHIYRQMRLASPPMVTEWGTKNPGFIFLLPERTGYRAKIFDRNKDGHIEFKVSDDGSPVSLRDWMAIAMAVDPQHGSAVIEDLSTINEILQTSSYQSCFNNIVTNCLQAWHHTQETGYLLPVAQIMQQRGFYSDLIRLYEMHGISIDCHQEQELWNSMISKTTSEIFRIEIEPVLLQKKLDFHLTNISNFIIDNLELKVNLSYNNGTEDSFDTSLTGQGRIFDNSKREIRVRAPENIELTNISEINYKVTALTFSN